MDLGVLLSFPVESIAIRAVLATVGTILLVRMLLKTGLLRSPRARVATALAPTVSLVAIVLLTGTTLRLPMLMLPAQGVDALPIPVRDGYLHFAPIAAPLLVGTWTLIVGILLSRRGRAWYGARVAARRAAQDGHASPQVQAVARRVAAVLDVPVPQVVVADDVAGGAFVAGVRRPIMVLSKRLVAVLDKEELEGVVAHELAHVKRRDNLVAAASGAVRDLAFFVPGGGWAIRQLHRERELAADQLAAGATGRPGALASGLLKALDTTSSHRIDPCAAFAPSGGLVDRVRVLVDEQPQPSIVRRRLETAAVVGVAAMAVVAAIMLPSVVAGAERERDAVALVWSSTAAADEVATPTAQARAFDVYRRATLDVVESQDAVAPRAALDERSQENRRAALHACASEGAGCPTPERSVGLGIRPRPTITIDDSFTARWRPTPITGSDAAEGLRFYWLALK